MNELIPLSKNCPLQRVEMEEEAKTALRDRAAEIFYDELAEPHQVPKRLVEEFSITREVADEANECLHRIMRNYCTTCQIGSTATGNGIVARQ